MSNFFYKDETITEIKSILSRDRFSTYYTLAGANDIKAIKLYNRNILVSQRFYCILHVLEVCLRNKIDCLFQQRFGQNWLRNTDVLLTPTQKIVLADALRSCQEEALIPQLQFGFWTSFFGRSFEEIGRHHLRSLFNADKITRSYVALSLKEMRSFRNRIAHHEPIIHFPIQEYEHTAFELIGLDWLKQDLLEELS